MVYSEGAGVPWSQVKDRSQSRPMDDVEVALAGHLL